MSIQTPLSPAACLFLSLCQNLPLTHCHLPLPLANLPLSPAWDVHHAAGYLFALLQIHKTANAAYETCTPSRRHRERGQGSHSHMWSWSPGCAESSRKRRHSHSLHHESGSPSDHLEKHACNGAQWPMCDKPEFFHTSSGPCGRVCAVCLGRHKHNFSKCKGPKLWDRSPGAARKNEQGRLVTTDSSSLCFDWQVPRRLHIHKPYQTAQMLWMWEKWPRCSGMPSSGESVKPSCHIAPRRGLQSCHALSWRTDTPNLYEVSWMVLIWEFQKFDVPTPLLIILQLIALITYTIPLLITSLLLAAILVPSPTRPSLRPILAPFKPSHYPLS
jgi:hypothetical protein